MPPVDQADTGRVTTLLEEARRAHGRGWILIPLRGKRPVMEGWSHAPAPELKTVEQWAGQGNLGVRTGQVSGITVVDDDTDDGSGTKDLGLPVTPAVITGSGRWHFYFKCPDGGLGNSSGRLAPHVDVKGDGGQVVLPGSRHPDTGKTYEWVPGLSPEDVPLAELPPGIVEKLRTRRPKSKPGASVQGDTTRLRNYGRAALRNAIAHLGSAEEGARNETLNREAFSLGRLVGGGALDRTEVETSLREAALHAGLAESEVEATLRSGLDAGISEPIAARTLASDTAMNGSAPGQGRSTTTNPSRPSIQVVAGELTQIVDLAEKSLMSEARDRIYQRGSQLVRVVRQPQAGLAHGIKRPKNALVIRALDVVHLIERLTACSGWTKWDARRGKEVAIDCPARIAATLLAREGYWRVPVLRAVIEAPTIRPDGSVLEQAGFDEATGLYFDPGDTSFPPVPAHPTRDDAVRALELLKWPISEFPFATKYDQAAALAGMVTAVVRSSIRTAPLIAVSAPDRATGKSLLTDVLAMIATSRVAAVMTQGKDEEEDRKRILAVLMEGDSPACIDNAVRPIDSSALCSVLTQDMYRDRLLGVSRMVSVPTSITWVANGNNLVLAGDVPSRAIQIYIDARRDRPGERKFATDLRTYIPEHRGELVAAILTIVKAYLEAGQPDQGLPVFGRYEGWTDWVRAPLVWAGEVDPYEGRKSIEALDPVRRRLHAFLTVAHQYLKGVAFSASQAIRKLSAVPDDGAASPKEILAEIAAGSNGDPDARRLGRWLGAHANRVEGALRIERDVDRQGMALWRIVEVRSVGDVGDVGSVQTPRERCQGEGGDIHIEGSGTLPRNPRNPPMEADRGGCDCLGGAGNG